MSDWTDAARRQNGAAPECNATAEEKQGKAKSASTVLVEFAIDAYDFGVSGSGETFGIPRSGAKVVQMLRGGKTSLRSQLSRLYFGQTGKAASQQALADALLVLEGIAQETEPRVLHLRVANHGGGQWLDLGDATGRAVRITDRCWSVEPSAPVLFKRTALTAALPEPVRGGSLDELWGWLNVDPEDRPLVAGWLVAVLHADIPHPILSISGEQGSGKSTAERVLVSLLDPSPVPLRKPPRDTESWVTAAAGSWVVGLDNLSIVPDWLSDALCRAVTGDGDVRRRLYSDGDVHVFSFKRCLILNGIDIGAVRGDLADRLLSIDFKVIPEENRLTETEIWPEWDAVHPRLLGALLDLAAGVAGILSSVRLERKPRMADFACILAAVDSVLGTDGLRHYLQQQNRLATDSLTGDPFVAAIEVVGHFQGTSAELLDRVGRPEKPPKSWPLDPRAATAHLRRQAPVMRKAGWHIESSDRNNHDKVVVWTISPPPPPRDAGNGCPRRPQGGTDDGEAAGIAGIEYGPSQDDQGTERPAPPSHSVEQMGAACAHCGAPGADTDATDGTINARLHRSCFDAWFAA